jgi:hypothetical protein
VTDVEARLRDALAAHADHAPPPRQLLHLVRQESRRRRRRRHAGLVAALGAAVAVAVAVTGVSVVARERGGTDMAARSAALVPGPVSYVPFPFTPPSSAGKPTVMLVGGEPTLQYGLNAMSVTVSDKTPTDQGAVVLPVRPGTSVVIRTTKPLPRQTLRDYVAGFEDRPLAMPAPFTFDLVPAGFTVDNATPSAVTFAPPGVAPSAGFDGKVAVLLDEGTADGTEVTAEVVILHRSVGDGHTITVQVPASVALTGADLARFAAGIRPTGSAAVGHG